MSRISKEEYSKRAAAIEALETVVSNLQEDIYNRKANILQTWYGAKMDSCGPFYTDNVFLFDGKVFMDVDHALEYVEHGLNGDDE